MDELLKKQSVGVMKVQFDHRDQNFFFFGIIFAKTFISALKMEIKMGADRIWTCGQEAI